MGFLRTLRNVVGAGGIAAAVLAGTYGGRDHDFAPFYVHKIGTSYGISVGLVTEIEPEAKHNGLVLSLLSSNHGTINGGIVGLFNMPNESIGKINGVEIGVGNITDSNHCFQIGLVNGNYKGMLQVGGINMADHGLQLGVANLNHPPAKEFNPRSISLLAQYIRSQPEQSVTSTTQSK